MTDKNIEIDNYPEQWNCEEYSYYQQAERAELGYNPEFERQCANEEWARRSPIEKIKDNCHYFYSCYLERESLKMIIKDLKFKIKYWDWRKQPPF
tara:strand:- start:739 stop:1023 length:285 start_codon:yes stop_codon:yes gene_type:complete